MVTFDIVHIMRNKLSCANPNPFKGWFSRLCLVQTYLLQDPGVLGIFGLMLSNQTLRSLSNGLDWESKQWVDLRWKKDKYVMNNVIYPNFKIFKILMHITEISATIVSCVYVYTRYWLYSNSFFPLTERRLSGSNPDIWFSTWSSMWLFLQHTHAHAHTERENHRCTAKNTIAITVYMSIEKHAKRHDALLWKKEKVHSALRIKFTSPILLHLSPLCSNRWNWGKLISLHEVHEDQYCHSYIEKKIRLLMTTLKSSLVTLLTTWLLTHY